jgi:hypothetical protein
MEKIPKSSSELSKNSQINESNKIKEEKTSSNTKESQSINTINISQRNDTSSRLNNTNNIIINTESLYPLLFT